MVSPNRERVFAPFSELRDEPVIVLAATNGTGKSIALEQEHQALTPAASCLVDLKTAAGRHDPVAYLSEKAKIPAQVPEGAWHVRLRTTASTKRSYAGRDSRTCWTSG